MSRNELARILRVSCVHEECTVRRIESRARAKQGRRITRERKKGERETEGRGGRGKETNNRSRLVPGRSSTIATFPGRKTDPEPRGPGRSDCNRRRRWIRLHWRAADVHESERASERASESASGAAGHAEVNGCGARERFFGPENVRRGCQPGYLVPSRRTPRRAVRDT